MVVNGGADAFRELARRSHRFSSGDYIIEAVEAALEDEAPTLVGGARAEAVRILPAKNGLGRLVARLPIVNRVTRRRGSVLVKIKALPSDEMKDPAAANRGRLRHPTYGHRPQVIQQVPPGWFTAPMLRNARQVRTRVSQAVSTAIRRF